MRRLIVAAFVVVLAFVWLCDFVADMREIVAGAR